MPERSLGFGLRQIPDDVVTCWGARLIWPNSLVWDRQDIVGPEPDRHELTTWLNGGALNAALNEAYRMAGSSRELEQHDDRVVTLYEDDKGVVKANPQGSHGYLYVAGWLK